MEYTCTWVTRLTDDQLQKKILNGNSFVVLAEAMLEANTKTARKLSKLKSEWSLHRRLQRAQHRHVRKCHLKLPQKYTHWKVRSLNVTPSFAFRDAVYELYIIPCDKKACSSFALGMFSQFSWSWSGRKIQNWMPMTQKKKLRAGTDVMCQSCC